MNARDIIVRILADDQTKTGLNSAAKNMSKIKSAASSLVKRLAGLATVGTFTALIKSSIDAASQLDDMSKKFGVSAEVLSQLQFVAKMSGVELEDLGNAFKFLSKNISEAENPASDAAMAFDMVGIKLTDLKGKSSDEVFLMLADRFSGLEDGANKTALALAIFGRAGANILPVMADGAEGIKRMREEAVRTGAALSAEEIQKLDAYGDALDRAGMIAKSTAGRITMHLIGAIEDLWKKVEEKGPKLERFFARVFGGDAEVAAVDAKNLAEGHVGEDVDAGGEYKPKTKPGSIEARKAGKKESYAAAKEELKRKTDLYKEAGKVAHDALAEEMGTSQTYTDFRLKEEAEITAGVLRGEEERTRFHAEETAKRGEITHDALIEEREITEKIAEYRAQDALDAALKWGNMAQALDQLNGGLYEQFRIMDEQSERISATGQLYSTVFRGADGIIADLSMTAINAFNGMTDAIVEFAMTGKFQFKDFANNVIADLMRIAARQVVVQPLAQGLMGAFGISLPGKAAGGPVIGGTPYIVGERGPEVFVPGSSGEIIPNGAGGSNSVSVNIRNDSGQPVEARTARASFNAQGWVIDVVLDGINRNVRGLRTALGGA